MSSAESPHGSSSEQPSPSLSVPSRGLRARTRPRPPSPQARPTILLRPPPLLAPPCCRPASGAISSRPLPSEPTTSRRAAATSRQPGLLSAHAGVGRTAGALAVRLEPKDVCVRAVAVVALAASASRRLRAAASRSARF
eukprot:scaffold61257_cov34-Tisochrysis_lutea.AAC.7